MAKTFTKTSITNSEVTPVATKFAVSYIRVSTKAQTGEDKSGIQRQEQDYLNWLESHPDYENLDGFEFRDLGVSGRGKNSEIGALSSLIKAAEKGEIPKGTCLVVENWSRLTRSRARGSTKLLNTILDSGLELAFVQSGGKPFDGTDDASWFQFLGASMGAASEWEEKRCRKIGNEEKKAKQLAEGDFSSFKPRKKELKVTYIHHGFM